MIQRFFIEPVAQQNDHAHKGEDGGKHGKTEFYTEDGARALRDDAGF